ncbi:hypothetical protein ACOMHN_032615 [Nucella lapillus]
MMEGHTFTASLHEELSEAVKEKLDIVRNALTETQEAIHEVHGDLEEDDNMKDMIKSVYEKPGTDMGDFWISFMEMTDPLAQNLDACHARNGPEYVSSTYDMLKGLMAYNKHDYGRWLPDYWAMLSSLADEQKTFFNAHFAQSMTGLPYSCQPLDLWIETTMNLNSKLKQGWLQLLQNEKQLFSTIRNVNNVARVKAAVQQNLKCERHHRKHVECQPARMKKDEQAIQDLQGCMTEFNAQPFDTSSPALRSLQSGLVASPELVQDLNTAFADGQDQVETLLNDRVFTKTKLLTATIHKNKRQTFASERICASVGASTKVAQMEKSGLAALVDLVNGSGMFQLDQVLEGRVTEECLSLYNVDGSFRKTMKSKIIKDDEHDRRAAKHGHIPNVFPKPEDTFPGAAEFNQLMVRSGNKVRLQKLVKKKLEAEVARVGCEVIYCEGETAVNLSTGVANGDYVFRHPEADTMLLSAYAKLRTGNYRGTVVLDSEDTDVHVQAAYLSQQLPGDLLIKRKDAFINCRDMLSNEVSQIIIPLHVITGSDHTSGFYGHGKKTVMETAMTIPEARELLERVGKSLDLENSVKADMKSFVFSSIYGESADATCGQARASKWHKMKRKSTFRLPPDEDSLNLHVERTNYITYCQLHYNLFDHPSPIGHGWELVDGKCRPVRHTQPPLPQQLTLCDYSDESGSDDERSEPGDSTDTEVV